MELVESARKFFLKPGITLKKAYRKLQELCSERNLSPPPETYLEGYIYKYTSRSEFSLKKGIRYQKSVFSPSLASFQGACMPMQVLQMDNTSFDVFPVDETERKSLSTPNLTAAIDCYTRMITGFTISFFPSSSQSVLEVLVQSILSKDEYTKGYETQFEWPIKGYPVLLLVDNGMDFRANIVREFCMKQDIILEYAPIRTPRYKAFIEQWFNVLHKGIVDEDIGGVRPSLKTRLLNPDLKPDEEAVLTLQEIETWTCKWIVDEYHLSNQYKDHVPAPFLRLKSAMDGRTKLILPAPRDPPSKSIDRDILYLSTLDQYPRSLGSDGIIWEYLKYNNKALGELYNTVGNVEITFLLDRRDVRQIWVINPTNAEPIRVELASGWAQEIANFFENKPIHKTAWKREIRLLKQKTDAEITPYLYGKMKSRIAREELQQNAMIAKKSVRKEREKIKEASIKSTSNKLNAPTNSSVVKELETIEKEKPKKKIDWSTIKKLPTDEFYRGS